MSNVAEIWWSNVAHATWQSALLGCVLLALVWALRRLPASLRYGLLLIALLKFAVPPMMAFPTGVFSRPQVAAFAAPVGAQTLESQPEFGNAPVLSTPEVERGTVPVESFRATTPAAVEVAAQDVQEEVRMATASPPSLPSPVVEPPDTQAILPPAPIASRPAWMTWKTLLLLVHGIGCIVVAWCIVRTCRAIRRLTRSSRVITDGPLHILLTTIAERLGLRREVRLLLAPAGTPPMAFGMLRPTVVLPEGLTQQLGGDRLTALLAHELAHHRRHDPLLMVLENLLLLAWWFNPVLWLVLKTVRRTREDCCDDLVLAHGIADNETYCDSLVQAASAMIGPSPVGAALGFADRLHPLGRRLQRIMDATIRRPRRLPLAGLVAVVVLSLVALPGLRMVSALDESTRGLVAYYPLDGDARDASGHGNHGTVSGASATTDRFGNTGSALHFSGNGSGVECPNSDSLNIHGRTSLTIGAWIRAERNDVGRHQGLVWKWGRGMAEDDQFVFGLQNQGAYFGLSDIPSRVTSGPLPVGDWFSLVGVYDVERQRLKLYVNGELETSKRIDSVIRGTTQPLYLGKAETRRSFFRGDLDEVRIYNRPLAEDEIGELYGGPPPRRPRLTVDAPSSQEKHEADAAAHHVVVQARQAPGEEWQGTGISFRSGSKVTFSATGRVKWDPGLPSVTPQGAGRTPLGSTGRPHEFLAPSAPCGALIGKVGENGEPFFIGESLTHIVANDGELFLGVNDRVPHFMDNDGEFNVYVALSIAQRDKTVQGTAQSREAGGQAIETEIRVHYAKADAGTQDYIRRTAQSFGKGRLWFAADAFDSLTGAQREEKVKHIVNVLNGEYGRGLCGALAEAGALQDRRLLPGLTKVAAYHRNDTGYDCRAKWMAVAALGRQGDESVVPTLVPLLDHGNENTRIWALASLVRLTGQNLGADKKAWAKWWNESGKEPRIDASQLRPWVPPPGFGGAARVHMSRTVPAGGIGPQGGVLRFDGKDDFIHIPSAPQFDIKGDLTVSAWVRADPDCRDSGVFRRGDAQPAHDPYSLGAHPGKMAFDIGGGPGNTRDTARAAADLDKEWHCWTGVRDSGAGKLRLYKDGQLVSEVDDALPYEYPTSRMYNEIGACDAGRWGSWGYFKGEIDQVSVWKIPLESEQVRALFARGAKGDEPGLVGLWLFDGEGQTVKDSSSFGCHAPLGRTPEPDASDPTRIALPAAIGQADEAIGPQSTMSGTQVVTVQATTPGFDGWYLDLETLAQPEGIGTGRSARNLLLTRELVPGAHWRFVGKDHGFLIQAITAPYDGWCLHYDEAKESEMIEGWASVRNLILAERPSPSTHWTLTKTDRGHLIQASAGRYRDWYLDLAAGEEPSTVDGYLSCRNLVLSEELPAGGYWKLTATQKAASGTEPEASQASPIDAAKLSDDELRGLVSSDNDACREVRNRHLTSLSYLEKNWRGRLPIWKEAAERGIPEGRVLLGLCYSYGVGVEKDPAKEVELMRAAARQGDPTAMFNLALASATGNGIERDREEALKWYRKAAELGDSCAMRRLGWCYQRGRFLPQDLDKAAELYRESAEKGNAGGMLLLGEYLLASDGGVREQAEGIEWIRRAAELGYEEAGARLRELEAMIERTQAAGTERTKAAVDTEDASDPGWTQVAGGTVSGTVLIKATNLPAPGKVVYARKGDVYISAETVTDKNGAFTLTGLPAPVMYNLAVKEDAYGFAAERNRRVFVEQGEHVRGMDIVLDRRRVPVSGRVVDATTGEPLAGVKLGARSTLRPGSEKETASEEDGTYVFSMAPGWCAVTCEVTDDDGAPPMTLEQMVMVGFGGRCDRVDFSFPPDRSVCGRVLDAESRPIEGVSVSNDASRNSGGWHWRSYTKTDSDGAYRLCAPSPMFKHHRVFVTCDGYYGASAYLDPHRRLDAERRKEGLARLGAEHRRQAHLAEQSGDTREQERNTELAQQTEEQLLELSEYLSLDPANLDFIIGPEASISGRLTDTEGRGLGNAYMSLIGETDPALPRAAGTALSAAPRGAVKSGLDGSFDVKGVAPGSYAFRVNVYGDNRSFHQNSIGSPVAVASGQCIADLDVVIQACPEDSIEGHVRDEQGLPVPCVEVDAVPNTGLHWRAMTDDSGYYCLRGVGEQSFGIRFSRPGYLQATLEDVKRDSQDTDVVMARSEAT